MLALAVAIAVILRPPARPATPAAAAPPNFSRVFVIVMENQSAGALMADPGASYIKKLAGEYAYDSDYYGVTHPSLPNYVALISGTTFGTHSDSPAQRFSGPTLAGQLDAAHISWQGVMESLPVPGFGGSWYPSVLGVEGAQTLYALKHDPFMLFSALRRHDASHIVPLTTLGDELRTGRAPRFVFVVPNLCHDMHGQPDSSRSACPESAHGRLVRSGNDFLARWVPRILNSKAWTKNAVLFIVWDEGGGAPTPNPARLRQYAASGPAAPPLLKSVPILGRLGGGRVPLIVVAKSGPRHLRLHLWADHYSILKTVEAAWHLPYLGHAGNASVPLLTPLVQR